MSFETAALQYINYTYTKHYGANNFLRKLKKRAHFW